MKVAVDHMQAVQGQQGSRENVCYLTPACTPLWLLFYQNTDSPLTLHYLHSKSHYFGSLSPTHGTCVPVQQTYGQDSLLTDLVLRSCQVYSRVKVSGLSCCSLSKGSSCPIELSRLRFLLKQHREADMTSYEMTLSLPTIFLFMPFITKKH